MNDGGAIHLNPEKNTSLLCISSCFLGFYPLKHEKQDLECSPPPPELRSPFYWHNNCKHLTI